MTFLKSFGMFLMGSASLLAAGVLPWILGGATPIAHVLFGWVVLVGAIGWVLWTSLTWRDRPAGGIERWGWGAAWVLWSYVLISALNARASTELVTFGVQFNYRSAISWLPHSYAVDRTGPAFVRYSFLLLMSGIVSAWLGSDQSNSGPGRFPLRLEWLLTTLTISGTALGCVAIAQRLANTDNLLFLVPRRLPGGVISGQSSFGPFPYQTNGAQYFNLVWPIVLGWWWVRREARERSLGTRERLGTSPSVLLLPSVMLLMACPFLSRSRGGVAVAMLQGLAVTAFILWRGRSTSLRMGRLALLGMVGALAVAAALGWNQTWDRFKAPLDDKGSSGRFPLWRQAWEMAWDFQPWGSGAETYERVVHLYLESQNVRDWEAAVHSDWLEAWLSLGVVGCGIGVVLGMLVVLRWLKGPWLPVGRDFSFFVSVPLLGLLLHALIDLPFRIFAIFHLFLILLVIWMWCPPFFRERRAQSRERRAEN